MSPWWTDNMFGVWLGIGHALVVAMLAGGCAWFIYRGERRATVTRIHLGMIAFGAVAALACVIALVQGQHFRVWYPLAMMGGVTLVMAVPNLIALDWLYRRHDNRRLAAEELRRS